MISCSPFASAVPVPATWPTSKPATSMWLLGIGCLTSTRQHAKRGARKSFGSRQNCWSCAAAWLSDTQSVRCFRNTRGKKWTRNAIDIRFAKLREQLRLKEGTVAYSCRHTFITDGLAHGVPIATMAELAGHTSTSMITKHYSHLCEKVEHMQSALAKTVGSQSS